MTLIFPIVGLRHYIDSEWLPEFVSSLPEGAEVRLIYDNANAHDRYAIQAWMQISVNDQPAENKLIGYVSSDYAPMIRHHYPDAHLLYATVVHPTTSVMEETYFEAQIEMDDLTIPIPQPRIDLGPIAHIPLPTVLPEKRMVWDDIMRYSQLFSQLDKSQIDDDLVSLIIALAHRSAPYFGHSLSGDERNAYILLSTMLTTIHSYWTNDVMDVWEERMNIEDIHRDAYKTPELCAQVMEEEMQSLERDAQSFFEQYRQVLASMLTTKEQERAAHQQWLTQLPNNLYAWIKDRPQFASKLYYERFSTDELYAIYMHMLCLEWLSEQRTTPLPQVVEHAIPAFSFWNPDATAAQKRRAVVAWREANIQHHEPVATLALRIKQQQDALIVERKLSPFTQFVTELNRFLDHPVKENSLRKRLIAPHHDAYCND